MESGPCWDSNASFPSGAQSHSSQLCISEQVYARNVAQEQVCVEGNMYHNLCELLGPIWLGFEVTAGTTVRDFCVCVVGLQLAEVYGGHSKGGEMLVQVAQRCDGCLVPGDSHDQAG